MLRSEGLNHEGLKSFLPMNERDEALKKDPNGVMPLRSREV